MMRYAYRVFCIGLFGIMGSLHGNFFKVITGKSPMQVYVVAAVNIQNQIKRKVTVADPEAVVKEAGYWNNLPWNFINHGNVYDNTQKIYKILIDNKLVAEVRFEFNRAHNVHSAYITDKTGTAKNDNGHVGDQKNPVCLHYPDFKIKIEPHLYDDDFIALVRKRKFSIYIQDESAVC